jgi:hypothetical protein
MHELFDRPVYLEDGTCIDGTTDGQAANAFYPPGEGSITLPSPSDGDIDWNFEEDIPLSNAKKADLTGGHWVTIEGRHVYLKGGKVVTGPKSLLGKDIKDVTKGGKAPTVKKDVPAFTLDEDRGAAAAYAKETHGEWAKNLSKDQRAALSVYGGENYQSVNEGLRAGKVPEAYKQTVKDLDSAIDAAPAFSSETKLYRGIADGVAEELKVGTEFQDHGYTSTSINRHVASGFAEDSMIEVVALKGTKAASVDAAGTSPYKDQNSENEYILPRGTKYKVTGKRDDRESGLTVFTVEIV